MHGMNIGQAAQASGISAKMIRHYETLGLLPKASRSESGYRQYDDTQLHTLRFIRHARDLGFSLDLIAQLVGLWQDRQRPSREVKALAQTHLCALEKKLHELQAMKAALTRLVDCCHGDERPECPIIATLADEPASTASAQPTAPGSTEKIKRPRGP